MTEDWIKNGTMTTVLEIQKKINGYSAPYGYFFIRIPKKLREGLGVVKGEVLSVSVSKKHIKSGKILFAEIGRENIRKNTVKYRNVKNYKKNLKNRRNPRKK